MSSGLETLQVARVLICEDEPLAREALRRYLRDVEWLEIVAEAESGGAALKAIQKYEPDLVFMDVQLPGMTGVEVLEAATHRAAVVFTTAFDDYAIRAFDLGAVDYLLKPFGKARLIETLDRVRVRLLGEGLGREGRRATAATGPQARIFGRRGGALIPVAVADLIRAESTAGGVKLITAEGSTDADLTLTELEARLSSGDFVRVHRSHLVHLDHVVSIRKYDDRRMSLRMKDGVSIVSSRNGAKVLRKAVS